MIPLSGFDAFKKYLFKKQSADIDSWHFKLHYRITFTIFTIATILTSAKAYFSKSITCSHSSRHSSDLIDTFCWINSTFSITEDTGTVPFYGLASSYNQSREMFVHSYYQWLPYFFFLQAISFYFPHLIWKLYEGGKITALTANIRGFHFAKDGKVQQMGTYVAENRDFLVSKRTVMMYLACEWLNLLNMMIQCRLLNLFLNVDLIKYDLDFGQFFESDSPKLQLLKRTFPTFGKCLFRDYGPSGDIQVTDVLCLLPVNMFNEKIFLVLWLYLNLLSMFTLVGLCLVTVRVIGLKFLPGLHEKWLRYCDSLAPPDITLVNDVTEEVGVKEFFLFYLFQKNLSQQNYIVFLKSFGSSTGGKDGISRDLKSTSDVSAETHPAYDYDV